MSDVFQAQAILPGVGLIVQSDDVTYLMSPSGDLKPKFSKFVESAVTKYGYQRLKPFTGDLPDMLDLFRFLSEKD